MPRLRSLFYPFVIYIVGLGQNEKTAFFSFSAQGKVPLCTYCSICCRQDNGSVCDPPIYASFGPQNITVITSQESHYRNAFLIGFTKTHFLHPPNYGYWDVSYIISNLRTRRLGWSPG